MRRTASISKVDTFSIFSENLLEQVTVQGRMMVNPLETLVELLGNNNRDSPTGKEIKIEEYPGKFNFTYSLQSERNSWLYSPVLRQVFIDSNKTLMVGFNFSHFPTGYFIRAVPVYSSPENKNDPVKRCRIHENVDDPSNRAHPTPEECHCCSYGLAGHVVRVVDGAYYFDHISGRHSVIVQLNYQDHAACTFNVPYTFSCKSSCLGRMNKHVLVLVFTLEDAAGDIYGRCTLDVKVCSNPKRDMEKMEAECIKTESPENILSSTPAGINIEEMGREERERRLSILKSRGIELVNNLKDILEEILHLELSLV